MGINSISRRAGDEFMTIDVVDISIKIKDIGLLNYGCPWFPPEFKVEWDTFLFIGPYATIEVDQVFVCPFILQFGQKFFLFINVVKFNALWVLNSNWNSPYRFSVIGYVLSEPLFDVGWKEVIQFLICGHVSTVRNNHDLFIDFGQFLE